MIWDVREFSRSKQIKANAKKSETSKQIKLINIYVYVKLVVVVVVVVVGWLTAVELNNNNSCSSS